ncbi:MAG: CoA pyrophosphatase [Pseudomonadota bacterium]
MPPGGPVAILHPMDFTKLSIEEVARRLETGDPGPSSDFDLVPGLRGLDPARLQPAAVLVPLVARPEGLSVVLTRRSRHLRHHPGQIAFPGGKIDPGDGTAEAAALREAEEEIALPRGDVEVIGALPAHYTVTKYAVTPVVAHIPEAFRGVAEAGEVDEIFEVPLAFLLDPANLQVQSRMWQGTTRAYYVIPYGPYYVWGATARMLKGFSDRLVEAR